MRNKYSGFSGGFMVVSLVLPLLFAQIETTYQSQGVWQSANGPYGGYVIRQAVHPNGDVYAGLEGGGVFLTKDDGNNWEPVNNDVLNRQVRTFAIRASGETFAGTAGGVFRETGDGSWASLNDSLRNTDVRALIINEANDDIFAGTRGGVFQLRFNTTEWDTLRPRLLKDARDVRALEIKANGDMLAGTAKGVFRFTGTRWDSVNSGLANKYVRAFVLNSSSQDLFAGTAGGVYRLKHNSIVWDAVNRGFPNSIGPDIRALAIKTNGDIFAATEVGVFLLRHNTTNWEKVGDLPDNSVFSLAIKGDQDILAGTLCGVFRSSNNGASWENASNGMTGYDVTAIAVNSRYQVFAGARAVSGCGTIGAGVFRSDSGRGQWQKLTNGLPGAHIQALAIKKANSPENIFAGTSEGVYRSDDNGASWHADSIGLGYLIGNSSRLRRIVSTVATKENGDVLAGTFLGGVFLKENNSTQWDSVNTGLPGLPERVINILAVNEFNDDVLAGTGNGVFYLEDNSNTWRNVSNNLPDSTDVSSLVVNSAGHIFAEGSYRDPSRNRTRSIFRSIDNGASWHSVNTGLTNRNVNALAINSRDVIFAATNGGVFSSDNNGDTWSEYNTGLPNLKVLSLSFDDQDVLYAGTASGGIFWSQTGGSREVRLISSNASPGSTVDVPIHLEAQGDENAVGVTIAFDSGILDNPQARLGKDAGSATRIINDSQKEEGLYGFLLSLPSDQTFPTGTREILVVSFDVTEDTEAEMTAVDFADSPISREVVNRNATPLATTWTPGKITISQGFEADVAPRFLGNGSVTIADWVQVGRFAAGLDMPRTDVNEFQKADCAPKPCGDGNISISDWVQAGRYAAGLDDMVPACGATSPGLVVAQQGKPLPSSGNFYHSSRAVRLASDLTNCSSGQPCILKVELEAQGDENALGFSLAFDSDLFTFESADKSEAAADGTLIVNGNLSGTGQVGLVLAMPAGQAFEAGSHEVLEISFTANSEVSLGASHFQFTDEPVAKEVVNVSGEPLETTFDVVVSVAELRDELPQTFALAQNYPNPFNPETTIRFDLPKQAHVVLKIYDILGREVRTLVNENLTAGVHNITWNGRDKQEQMLASGIYIYKITAGSFSAVRKMVFAK